MNATAEPISPDLRRRVIAEYLDRVGPFIEMRTRLAAHGAPWTTVHIEVIDKTVARIMHNIAHEHGLETIEGI